jgi:hypothetical protein
MSPGMQTFMGVSMALLAALLLIPAGSEFYQDWRFALHAHSTQGAILSKQITKSSGRRSVPHYRARYRFAIDGSQWGGEDELAQSAWDQLTQGGSAEILYLPDDPASNRLAGSRAWYGKGLAVLLGVPLLILGVAVARQSRRRTAAEGRAV